MTMGCRDERHLRILTRSVRAFFLEFQQNSSIATMIARARPHKSTTNTPPGRKFWFNFLCNHSSQNHAREGETKNRNCTGTM